MTKKSLIKMLRGSLLAKDPDEKKRAAYCQYYGSIENALYVFPDETEIKISSANNKEFKSQGAFQIFTRNANAEEIERVLSSVLSEIRTWIDSRPSEVIVLTKRKKRKKSWFAFFSAVIIITIVAATVLEALKISGRFETTLEWVSDAVDGLGLITGLAFFLYERIDDRRSAAVHKDYENLVTDDDASEFDKKYRTYNLNIGFCNKISQNTYNYYSTKREDDDKTNTDGQDNLLGKLSDDDDEASEFDK